MTISAGVPALVVAAAKHWELEVLVLREVTGILQTLTYDSRCVRAVLQADLLPSTLKSLITSVDADVSSFSIATLANILSFTDGLLLADSVIIESLGLLLPTLLDLLRNQLQGRSSLRSQRFYAMAGIANACAHPRLQSILKSKGGECELIHSLRM